MAGNNHLSAFNPDFGRIPGREVSKTGYNQPSEGVTPGPGEDEMLLSADGSFRGSLRLADAGRGIAPLPGEPEPVPPPEPYTPPEPGPTPPLGGDFDWIAPEPRLPAEPTCRCVLEVLPDISEGAYTGRFRLVGAQSAPDTYSIFGLNDDIQFRHAAGGPHNPWRNALTGTMQCGEEIEFKASARTPFTRHVVVGQWGSLTCVQEIGVEPPGPPPSGKCACDAFFIRVDDTGNLVRQDAISISIPPADPGMVPPPNRMAACAVAVVATEGGPGTTTWWASSKLGYATILAKPCANELAGCDTRCGDLDIFCVGISPTALALLDKGATPLSDEVLVTSSRGLCSLLLVKFGLSADTDPSAFPHGAIVPQYRFQTLQEDATVRKCADCYIPKGKRGQCNITTILPASLNSILTPYRYERCLIEMCLLGWTLEAKEESFNENFGFLEFKVSSEDAFPDIAWIDGPRIRVRAYWQKILYAASADHAKNFERVRLALTVLASYLRPSSAPNKITKTIKAGDTSKCYGTDMTVKCLREAVRWVDVKARNWRIIDTYSGDNLKLLWDNVKYSCTTIDAKDEQNMKYSGYIGGGIINGVDEEVVLEAIRNTRGTPNRDYSSENSQADDVFIYFGHVSGTNHTIGLTKRVGTWIDSTKFQNAARKLTGVVILCGCGSDVLSKYFSNASVKIMIESDTCVIGKDFELMTGQLKNAILSSAPDDTWASAIGMMGAVEGQTGAKWVPGSGPYNGEEHDSRQVWAYHK